MAVFRVERNTGYTVMSNHHLRNKELSLLVNDMIIADNLHSAVFSLAAYTVILCFSLFKSGTLAKSIFNAH